MIRERNRPCPFDENNISGGGNSIEVPPLLIQIAGFQNNEYYERRNIELINLEEREEYRREKISSAIYSILDSTDRTKQLIREVANNRSRNFRNNFFLLPRLYDKKTIFKVTLLKENGQIFEEITHPTEITLKKDTQQPEDTEEDSTGQVTPTTPPTIPFIYTPIIVGLLSGNPRTYIVGNNISIANFDPGTNRVVYNYRIGNDYRGLKNVINNRNSFSVSFSEIPAVLDQREGILTANLYKDTSSSSYKLITVDRLRTQIQEY